MIYSDLDPGILTGPCATPRFPHRPPNRRQGYKHPGFAPFTIEALGCWIFPRQGHLHGHQQRRVQHQKYSRSPRPHPAPNTNPSHRPRFNQPRRLPPHHRPLRPRRHIRIQARPPAQLGGPARRHGKIRNVVPTFSAKRFLALRSDEICFADDCWVYRVTRRGFVRG